MSADLVVTGFASGAVFEVDAAEDGIFAVAGANFENGLLDLFFALLILAFDFLLACERGVVGEEIGLGRSEFGMG